MTTACKTIEERFWQHVKKTDVCWGPSGNMAAGEDCG